MAMTIEKREEYVSYAEYCVKLARQTNDPESLAILREMAAEGLRLADAAAHQFWACTWICHRRIWCAGAAKEACSFEEKGNNEEAKTWWRIEAALKLMRGPHEG